MSGVRQCRSRPPATSAQAFCRHIEAELTRGRSRYFDAEPSVCVACDRVCHMTAAVNEPCWHLAGDEQGLTLVDCLRAARRPYDERLARERARQRREDAHRARLRADPEALREHLRGRMTLPPYMRGEVLGEPRARALELLIGGGGPPRPVERAALEAPAGGAAARAPGRSGRPAAVGERVPHRRRPAMAARLPSAPPVRIVYSEPDAQYLDGRVTVARSCSFCASSQLESWPPGSEPADPSPHEQAYW
jgi:hypothetical protein